MGTLDGLIRVNTTADNPCTGSDHTTLSLDEEEINIADRGSLLGSQTSRGLWGKLSFVLLCSDQSNKSQ